MVERRLVGERFAVEEVGVKFAQESHAFILTGGWGEFIPGASELHSRMTRFEGPTQG